MRTTRTYYEILGLPKDATLAMIKRRYKQLARKYHPDVAEDKVMAHRLFIQIAEAYDVLSDASKRRAYDAGLNMDAARIPSGQTQARGRSDSRTESTAAILQEAQFAFIHRQFSEAIGHCRRAIAMDPHSARAYTILGDVYRVQGKPNEAIKWYGFALQFNPSDTETEKKLMNLVSKRAAKMNHVQVESHHAKKSAALIVLNVFLVGLVLFLLYMIDISPGQPIALLKRYAPPISLWSTNLAILIAAASVLAGFGLSINGILANPDEELIFEGGTNWAVVPTGLILLLGSGFFFLGAAGFYLLVGLIQESLSKSVTTVFACVTAIVLVAALMYNEPAVKQVLLFGGNVSFIPMLVGWHIGAAFRPMGE